MECSNMDEKILDFSKKFTRSQVCARYWLFVVQAFRSIYYDDYQIMIRLLLFAYKPVTEKKLT